MSSSALDVKLENLRGLCTELKHFQDDLNSDDEMRRRHAKTAIVGTKKNLKERSDDLVHDMENLDEYDLNDDAKKFWRKFNDKVMRGWTNNDLCVSCKILKDFS